MSELNGIIEFDAKTGLKIFNKASIFADLKEITSQSFGPDFVLQQGSEFYTFIDLLSDSLAHAAGACLEVYNSLGFVNATGVTLDNCVALAGITRKAAVPSKVLFTATSNSIVDSDTVVYPAGTIIQDVNGNQWQSSSALTIPAGEDSASIYFYSITDNTSDKFISANNEGQSWIIKSSIGATLTPSSDITITSAAAVKGTRQETDDELKARYALALYGQSSSTEQALTSKLLNLGDITYARIVQNVSTEGTDKYNIPIHAIWPIVKADKGSSWNGVSAVYSSTGQIVGFINFASTSSLYIPSTYDNALSSSEMSIQARTISFMNGTSVTYDANGNVSGGGTIDLRGETLTLSGETYTFSYSSNDPSDIEIAKTILKYKSLGCGVCGGMDDDFSRGYKSTETVEGNLKHLGQGLVSSVVTLEDQPNIEYRIFFTRASKVPVSSVVEVYLEDVVASDDTVKANITNRIRENIIAYVNKLGISNDVLYGGVASAIYKAFTDSGYTDYVFDLKSLAIGVKGGSESTKRIPIDIYEYPFASEEDLVVKFYNSKDVEI